MQKAKNATKLRSNLMIQILSIIVGHGGIYDILLTMAKNIKTNGLIC